MRGSTARAAASARARVVDARLDGDARGRPGRRARDRAASVGEAALGQPARGSGAVARPARRSRRPARSIASRREIAGRGRRRSRSPPGPRRTRGVPSARSRACFTKSISSPRTRASSESRSRRAPRRRRRRRRACARASARSIASVPVSAGAHPSVPPTVRSSMRIVGRPDADRHATGRPCRRCRRRVEREVVADARDARQHVGAVADQRRALHRRAEAAVLDPVGLARAEHELAARDVDLPAAERHRVEAARRPSAGSPRDRRWPASMKVLVMRGIGRCA